MKWIVLSGNLKVEVETDDSYEAAKIAVRDAPEGTMLGWVIEIRPKKGGWKIDNRLYASTRRVVEDAGCTLEEEKPPSVDPKPELPPVRSPEPPPGFDAAMRTIPKLTTEDMVIDDEDKKRCKHCAKGVPRHKKFFDMHQKPDGGGSTLCWARYQ